MSEHTPGPWYATPIYMPYDYEDAYGGEPVCWRVTDKEPWGEDGEYALDLQVDTCDADARLIAAAPDLLKALYALVNQTDAPAYSPTEVENARAAIAKARGEE